MTMIVDANGPHSSRPGLAKVLAEVDAHHAANGHAENTVETYAPPTDPERMKRTKELTGQVIRDACKLAGKAVLDLVDQAEREIEAIALQGRQDIAEARKRALEFDTKVNDIGGYHATELEDMLTGMSSVHAITEAVRKQVTELTASYSQKQDEQAA